MKDSPVDRDIFTIWMFSAMDANNSAYCICCRRSLNRIGGTRRRSYSLTAEFMQNNPPVITFLVEIATVVKFSEEDKICRPCLQRAQRYHVKKDDNLAADPLYQSMQEDRAEEYFEPEQPKPNVNVQDREVQVNMLRMIPLPGYTRAPFNTHVCIIAACNNRVLKRIHIDIRATVLQKKCLYIPRGTRVCEEHNNMLDLVWQNIESRSRRLLSQFSPSHLKDMMDILRTRKVPLDFDRRSI